MLAKFRNPVGVITKSALVTRDLDLLAEIATHRCVSVTLSVTKPKRTCVGCVATFQKRQESSSRREYTIERGGLTPVGSPV